MVFKIGLFINQHFIELKEDKGTDYVISWKSKGVYNSKLAQLYTVFLHNIKLFKYKIRIQFNKNVLVVEKGVFVTVKGVDYHCIIYELANLRQYNSRKII